MDWSIPHVLTKVNVMLLHIGKRHLSYGEKVDLINIFEAEKNFRFLKKKKNLLNMNVYCSFPSFVILPVRIHLTACLVFYLLITFLLKLLELNIYFTALQGLGKCCSFL